MLTLVKATDPSQACDEAWQHARSQRVQLSLCSVQPAADRLQPCAGAVGARAELQTGGQGHDSHALPGQLACGS